MIRSINILKLLTLDIKLLCKWFSVLKNYLISGSVNNYKIKTNLFAISPNQAIKVFQQKYPDAKDIYVIQKLFK